MTFKQLALLVSRLEGKKKSLSIAQISEVLSIVKRLILEDPMVLAYLLKPAAPKAKRR